MNKYPPSSNPWRDPPVRCVDCRFYPDDCGYWKPHKNANTVKPECWHGCPDYEPRETLGTDEREESPNA